MQFQYPGTPAHIAGLIPMLVRRLLILIAPLEFISQCYYCHSNPKDMVESLYPKLRNVILNLDEHAIPDQRRKLLKELALLCRSLQQNGRMPSLHFICTHNSRRSQFAQVWTWLATGLHSVACSVYSGGTGLSRVNDRSIRALRSAGFHIREESTMNQSQFRVKYGPGSPSLTLRSKLYNDPENPLEHFIAVMTCDHADQNCPFIPGAKARFSLTYSDPGLSDGTASEEETYLERSMQIAHEMFYLIKLLK